MPWIGIDLTLEESLNVPSRLFGSTTKSKSLAPGGGVPMLAASMWPV